MAKTRIDLAKQALANLGVLASGQSPSAEDLQTAKGHIDPVVASLRRRDIADIDADNIEDEFFSPLAVLVANDAALEFGLPGVPPSPSQPNPVVAAEMVMREISYERPSGLPQTADYF